MNSINFSQSALRHSTSALIHFLLTNVVSTKEAFEAFLSQGQSEPITVTDADYKYAKLFIEERAGRILGKKTEVFNEASTPMAILTASMDLFPIGSGRVGGGRSDAAKAKEEFRDALRLFNKVAAEEGKSMEDFDAAVAKFEAENGAIDPTSTLADFVNERRSKFRRAIDNVAERKDSVAKIKAKAPAATPAPNPTTSAKTRKPAVVAKIEEAPAA